MTVYGGRSIHAGAVVHGCQCVGDVGLRVVQCCWACLCISWRWWRRRLPWWRRLCSVKWCTAATEPVTNSVIKNVVLVLVLVTTGVEGDGDTNECGECVCCVV